MHGIRHQYGVWFPPREPPGDVDHDAVGVQDLPPDRKEQVGEPPEQQVGQDDHAKHRQRQLEQQVGTGPPADGIGQDRPGPPEGASLRTQRRRRRDLQSQQPACQAAVDRAEPPGAEQGHHQQRQPDQHASETERQSQADGDGDHDKHKARNCEQKSEGRKFDLPPTIPGERLPQQAQYGLPEPDPVATGPGRAHGSYNRRRGDVAPRIAGRGRDCRGLLAGHRVRAVHDGTLRFSTFSICAYRAHRERSYLDTHGTLADDRWCMHPTWAPCWPYLKFGWPHGRSPARARRASR